MCGKGKERSQGGIDLLTPSGRVDIILCIFRIVFENYSLPSSNKGSGVTESDGGALSIGGSGV